MRQSFFIIFLCVCLTWITSLHLYLIVYLRIASFLGSLCTILACRKVRRNQVHNSQGRRHHSPFSSSLPIPLLDICCAWHRPMELSTFVLSIFLGVTSAWSGG